MASILINRFSISDNTTVTSGRGRRQIRRRGRLRPRYRKMEGYRTHRRRISFTRTGRWWWSWSRKM